MNLSGNLVSSAHCKARVPCARREHHRGYTLLEMLVVVLVLMAVAGGAILAVDGLQETALNRTAVFEMQKIKNALRQYRADTGSYPAPAHPADFSTLYTQGTQPAWDLASGRGWRGPYLSRAGEGLVDVGAGLAADGSGLPVTGTALADVRAVADPYALKAVRNETYVPCDDDELDANCLLDFRTVAGQPRFTRSGRPYFLFELNDPERARLVSSGPDGRYAGVNPLDRCAPPTGADDLVLCLSR